jgi:hypothetical protein
MTTTTRYVLELVPEPSDVPAIIRLRFALKYLKRAQCLRCVSAVELPANGLRRTAQEASGVAETACESSTGPERVLRKSR